MSDPSMITITLSEYLSLLDDREMLAALEAAGVDNWEGYDMAMKYYQTGEEQW